MKHLNLAEAAVPDRQWDKVLALELRQERNKFLPGGWDGSTDGSSIDFAIYHPGQLVERGVQSCPGGSIVEGGGTITSDQPYCVEKSSSGLRTPARSIGSGTGTSDSRWR